MTDGFRGLPQGNVKVYMPTVWAIQFFKKKLGSPFFVCLAIPQKEEKNATQELEWF